MSGRPKIGSTRRGRAPAAVPVQRERRPVGHHAGAGDGRDDERQAERDQRSTGSTGSLTGWPLIRMVPPPMSPRRAASARRNEPYSTTNVTAAKALKTTRLQVQRRPEHAA